MTMTQEKPLEYVGPTWMARQLGVARNTARKVMDEYPATEIMRGRRRLTRPEGEALVATLRDEWSK